MTKVNGEYLGRCRYSRGRTCYTLNCIILAEPTPGKEYQVQKGETVAAVLGVKKFQRGGMVALVKYEVRRLSIYVLDQNP